MFECSPLYPCEKMATSTQVFRQLLKELKSIYKTNSLQDVPAYIYLENQFRRFQVTGEKECRGDNDVQHMAETYLCLLHSTRKYEELSTIYKGKGERSIESSARMVGLALPKKPGERDDPPKI